MDAPGDDALAALAAAVARGERAAVARALNLVEDRRGRMRAAAERLVALVGDGAEGHRVGVTGPPGAGKSTLLRALVRAYRARGLGVGVLAVDPSSTRSGGALLGDRVRIEADPGDARVFVRSLASGGVHGGLCPAVGPGVRVLARAYERVLVETTGVGQTESDVEHVADTVLCVVQPGAGDVLQFLKAGLMEVPELWVVNKSDQGATARRALRDLCATLAQVRAAGLAPEGWSAPVLATSAREGAGITELVDALEAHRAWLVERGELAARRFRGAVAWAVLAFARRYGEEGVERAGGLDALRRRTEEALRRGG